MGAKVKAGGKGLPLYAEAQIIVKFKSGVSKEKADKIIAKHKAKKLRKIKKLACQSLIIPAGTTVEEMVEKFGQEPDVEYAEPNYIVHAQLVPSDPQFTLQWALDNTGQTMGTPDADIDAPEAWDVETGDPTVIIAILDTGVALNHPDLINKLWVNTDEIPENQIDDDGNGFVDDYRGYDMNEVESNHVDDYHGHGTHCAGTAAADTDNGLGVVGVNINSKIMPVQVLNSSGSGQYLDVAEGIVYATDNGAKVISMSLGGYGDSDTLESAMQYAYNAGITTVCAAGNISDQGVLYPAAYDQYCLAVAATGPDDERASFSSIGPQVDVAAPGVHIYSTYRYINMLSDLYGWHYDFLSGTSMATPHVAGLAALIISQNPAFTNEQVMDQIRYTADDVNDSTYKGNDIFLGTGRINAFQALTTSPHPVISYEGYAIDDSGGTGNGDGRADPGETVSMTVTLGNSWADAVEVTGSLSTGDPYLTITDPSSSFGNINEGSSADNGGNPFTFTVDPGCPRGHKLTFTLDITAQVYSDTYTLDISAGRPYVLFVDDDGGLSVDRYYKEALDNAGLTYDVWDVPLDEDGPTAADMAPYDVVIWDALYVLKPTGWVYLVGRSLTVQDVQQLSAYLDGGGNLFLTSSNLLEHQPVPPELSSFVTDYLHAPSRYHGSTDFVAGVAQDIFDDITLRLPDGVAYSMTPDAQAQAIFTISDENSSYYGDPCALRYPASGPSTYRTVFLGFNIHGIQSVDGRKHVMSEVVNWLRQTTPPPQSNLAPTADTGDDQWFMDVEDAGSVTVSFDGSACLDPDGSLDTCEWKDGETVLKSSCSTFSKSLAVGPHFITLTVTDNGGAVDTDNMLVYIAPPLPANDGAYVPPPPSGPTTILTNTPYDYTVQTTDPDGDPVYYEIEWGDGFLVGTFTVTELHDSGVPVSILHTYTDPGTYEIRVQAWDILGERETNWDFWSDPLIVTVLEPDSVPPVISSVSASDVTSSSAAITWATDELSDSVVHYGTTTSLGSTAEDSDMVTSHLVTLTDLLAETTYYYEVQSTDSFSNTATDDNGGLYYTFTTTAGGGSTMHVDSIDMSLLPAPGRKTKATATVTVVDEDSIGVEGATVSGHWENATTDSDSGTTDYNGQVTLESDGVRRASSGTTFTFVVDDITLSGWTYDPAANVETSDNITVP
jgi:subtilisin family serine protease